MLYSGKRLADMTAEEMEQAAAEAWQARHNAVLVFELNEVALQELATEYEKRLGVPLSIEVDLPDIEPDVSKRN